MNATSIHWTPALGHQTKRLQMCVTLTEVPNLMEFIHSHPYVEISVMFEFYVTCITSLCQEEGRKEWGGAEGGGREGEGLRSEAFSAWRR